MKRRLIAQLAVAAAFMISQSPLFAQWVTTSGTNPYTSPYDFEYRTNGNLIAVGTYGTGSLLTSDQGAGTRLLWFPGKAAFRSGQVTGTQWNTGNIGENSVAFGVDTTANGDDSAAVGIGTISSGAYSLAWGYYTIASGRSAFAGGYSTQATGYYASALGIYNIANGNAAIALGRSTTANGFYSLSSGTATTAAAFCSVALGHYNVGLSSTGAAVSDSTWVATDPVLEIGNGTSTTPANALTVYKNGNTTAQGVITAGGGFMTTAASVTATDIPMFGH